MVLNEKKKIVENFVKNIFPNDWARQYDEVFYKTPFLTTYKLPIDSLEYLHVKDFFSTLKRRYKIEMIERIENITLWKKYNDYIELKKSQNVQINEKLLFHGTRKNNPNFIYKDGFDISFSNDAGKYGRGLYFAKDPNYSIPNYCYLEGVDFYVFLCKVYIGVSYNNKLIGSNQIKKPPILDEINEIYYDSIEDPQMVVVYENYKAYPFYLIKFRIC